MITSFHRASLLAVSATFVTALFGTSGSGAEAQDLVPVQAPAKAAVELAPNFISEPVVQPLPEPAEPADNAAGDAGSPQISAASLRELVAAQSAPADLSREMNCLAGAIYFEAKGESLSGQLAVGRVVVARSKSGRFPDSYCGVVYQPSQFSFVRRGAMPSIGKSTQAWRNAVAVARIAHSGAWTNPAEGALFFHAARVSPGWRLTRVARIDNHIFYR